MPDPTLNVKTDGTIEVLTADGLNVWITRVPIEVADFDADRVTGQLTVSINTEGMEPNGRDHDDGEPIMQVTLNDATLYDVEPGPDGKAVAKFDGREFERFMNATQSDDDKVGDVLARAELKED